MNKTVLLNVSIVSLIFGFVFLVYLLQHNDFTQQNYLTINGTILKIKNYPKITKISFKPDSLEVVSFKNVSFKKGEHVRLTGQLKNYKGRLEFVLR